VVREEDPSPTNPLGVKGAGEDGIVAAGGAVRQRGRGRAGAAGREITALPLAARRGCAS
jgi:CO/xanthine dehydrogenase Mo-binding subunit